jgi:arginyl-tRNA synthetase
MATLLFDQANAQTLKFLAVASASKVTVSVSKATPEVVPFGKLPALDVSGRIVFGSAAACEFLASESLRGTGDVQTASDDWVAIDQDGLGPAVDALTTAAVAGTKFPLSAEELGDEGSSLAGLYAVRCGVDTASKKGGAAPADVAAAFRHVLSTLQAMEVALSSNVFLTGATVTLADVVLAASLAPVVAGKWVHFAPFPHVAGWCDAMYALPAFKAAAADNASLGKSGAAGAAGSATAGGSSTALVVDGKQTTLTAAMDAAFVAAAEAAFPGLGAADFKGIASVNTKATFAHHYTCIAALRILPLLKKKGMKPPPGAPMSIAEAIVAALPPAVKASLIADVGYSKPAFINAFAAPSAVQQVVQQIAANGPWAPAMAKHTVAIDYSSPNIAKEMHVGHLRSTIIGDALARILEFCGSKVHRINHVGDWGTQFGMLIAHLKDTVPDIETNTPDIANLTKLYKDAKKRFDDDKEFNVRAHEEVVKLQAGDAVNRGIWKAICAASEAMFMEVYKRLGVDPRLETVGESFYNDKVEAVLTALREKGMLEKDNGADIVRIPGQEVPIIARKSDGGIGYGTTDLAALHYRTHVLKADWLVYVIDNGQSLHLENVFAAGKMAGWWSDDTHRVVHAGFGVVQGEDKKKFKTRSGETVKLVDLLDEARDRATGGLMERLGTPSCVLSEEEIKPAGEALGYGGVKYFDLNQNRKQDYVFSYDRMLDANGDTAVYMQYAHARVSSIIRKVSAKSGTSAEDVAKTDGVLNLAHASELALAVDIARFSEVVQAAAEELLPHRITEYLYRMCSKFSSFYRDCPVLGNEHQNSRLTLCLAYQRVLAQSLRLLGIEPLSKL